MFGFREVVGKARDLRVHLGSTPNSSSVDSSPVAILTRGGPTEENLGLLLDHHRVVAHSREVGAPGSGAAERRVRHGWDTGFGEPGEVSEPLSPYQGRHQPGRGDRLHPTRQG